MVALHMQDKSRSGISQKYGIARLHHTVMITLRESYEYITGDETGYSEHALQDDSIDGLNTNQPPRQRRCPLDHSQLVDALDKDRFYNRYYQYQDRELLRSTISKASSKVFYRFTIKILGKLQFKHWKADSMKATSYLSQNNDQHNRLSAGMQVPPR